MKDAAKIDLEKVLGRLRENLDDAQYLALTRGEPAAEADGAGIDEADLESLLDDVLSTSPPAESELCKRIALVRTFDRDLYETVLARDLPDGLEAPDFATFSAHADLAAVPRQAGVFRLREDTRERHLVAWTEAPSAGGSPVPERLLEFCRRLLEHFVSRGEDESIEALPIRMLLDPDDGRRLFETLYRVADQRFDLARCHALLETATAWTRRFQRHLVPAFTALLGERQQYYEARTLFLEDYHQTALYYLKDDVRVWLGRLQSDSSARADAEVESNADTESETGVPWIFHLHATGGMGKTMLLRWLIARESIPEPRRVPCARVDFDHLDLGMAARYPWLLLVLLAEQLNRQVPATPFLELLQEYGWLARTLRRIDGDEEEGRRRRDAEGKLERDPALREDVLGHMRSALAEIPAGQPVLLILDTLEEATLFYPESLLTTVGIFEKLHQVCPGLRLVLSGRYDIWERLPGMVEAYGARTDVFALDVFSDKESLDYLRACRQVPESAPLDAIVSQAKGIPFNLSLFAELALTREDLTAKEVLEYPPSDFAYLIDRVIERLPEQSLRWLIRYGVVPRDLTFDFLEQVIAPHLPRGPSEHDRPGQNLPEGAGSLAERTIWKPDGLEIDLEALWSLLGDYASSRGWISFTDTERRTLRFKPEVVDPMRGLLQPQPVFALLQEDAIAYFEARAARDPASWARWTAEALFHRFQREGAAAGAHWRRLLEDPRARRDPAARKLFSETVLDRSLAHRQREPRTRHGDTMMVDKRTLHEAHLEAASAALAMAPLFEREHTLWHEARRHMKVAEALRSELPETLRSGALGPGASRPEAAGRSQGRREVLAAAEALSKNELEKAGRYFGRALRLATNDRQRFSLRLQIAHVLALQDDWKAVKHYRAAILLAGRASNTHLPLYQVRRLLGQLLADHGEYDHATEELRRALTASRRAGDADESGRIARRLIAIDIEIHRFRDAERLLRALPEGDFATSRLEIELELALSRPDRALALVAELGAGDPGEEDLGDEERAWLDELAGRARGQLLALRDALELLETAKNRWADLGSTDGEARCRLHRLELMLLEVGDLGEAEFLLGASARSDLEPGSELWLRHRWLLMILRARKGDRERALELWRALLGAERVVRRPRLRAHALATGLALDLARGLAPGTDGDEDVALELVKTLRKVRPESARWGALAPLRLSDGPIEGLKRRRGKLLSLLSVPEKVDVYRLPEAQVLACVLRALPQEGKARDLYSRAERYCERQRLAVPMRCFLSVRATWPEVQRERPPTLDRIRESVEGEPQLEGALLLAAAQSTSDDDGANALLAEARALLTADALPSRFLAKLAVASVRHAASREEAMALLEEAAQVYELLEDPKSAADVRAEAEAMSEMLRPADREAGREDPPTARDLVARDSSAKGTRGGGSFGADFLGGGATRGTGDSAADSRGGVSSEPETIECTLSLRQDPNSAIAESAFIWPGRSPERHTKPMPHEIAVHGRSAMRIERTLLERLQGPDAGRWLGDLLGTGRLGELTVRWPEATCDLRLEIERGVLSAVPWELAWIPGDRRSTWLGTASFDGVTYRGMPEAGAAAQVRWLQSALNQVLEIELPVDGRPGPRSQQALHSALGIESVSRTEPVADSEPMLAGPVLERFSAIVAKAESKRPMRVLVLEPDLEMNIAVQRGLTREGAMSITNVYRYGAVTLDVRTGSEVDPKWLRQVLKAWCPDVLHIGASFRQSSSGEVLLQLDAAVESFRKETRVSGGLSTSLLHSLIERAYSGRAAPFVMLDVPAPPRRDEALRQLLMRNLFAADLMAQGAVWAVLGIGVEQQGDLAVGVRRKLVDDLQGTRSVGAMARDLRLESLRALEADVDTSLVDLAGSAGIALFAAHPALRPVVQER